MPATGLVITELIGVKDVITAMKIAFSVSGAQMAHTIPIQAKLPA
jgi:hypothetical protein